MQFGQAKPEEFDAVRGFYWAMIDAMQDQFDKIGWKKGVYPTDEFLRESLQRGELYTLRDGDALCACVILSSRCNDGYAGTPWRVQCRDKDVLIPHALAVAPERQGQGVGRAPMAEILALARRTHKKAMRLDILGTNTAAERLYTRCGFRFVQAKPMFYPDTGWTEYWLYEYEL